MLAEPVLVDTGAFAALFDPRDQHHAASKRQFAELPVGKSYTCWPVVTEAAYLARRYARQREQFLQKIANGNFPFLHLQENDLMGILRILRTYADQQIDFADAALFHLAEREHIRAIFTFDRRHFTLFRNSDGSPLHVVPDAFSRPPATMPKTRTFIAVEALDEVQTAALGVIDRLRSAVEGVKWVAPDNLHWTVQFLGDLDDREMAEACLRSVRVAAEHQSFELEARSVGAFPSIQRPRTLWLGAGRGGDQFRALQADVEASLAQLGFRGEGRSFTPHLTIGRTASRAGPGPGRQQAAAILSERLAKFVDFDGGVMSVDELIVFASEPGRDGPVYSVLARAPLA